MPSTPDVSVVLEWENVILAEDDRAFAMLRTLREELRRRPGAEVLVLFDPEEVARDFVAGAVREHLGPADGAEDGGPSIRIEECPGQHYYELKNEGARRANGRIVAFLDSDVIPVPGWLDALLRPFEDQGTDVVAGITHGSRETMFEKAFALGWIFPVSGESSEPRDVERFYANNVAFRRELLLRHPFPPLTPGTTRGACTRLARTLVREGVRIRQAPDARAEHPPPSGARHFLVRALAHGRDAVFRARAGGRRSLVLLLGALGAPVFLGVRGAVRIVRYRERVGLPALQVVPATAVMAGFYTLCAVGAVAALVAPEWSGARWHI